MNKTKAKFIVIVFLSMTISAILFVVLYESFASKEYSARTTVVVRREGSFGYSMLSFSHYLADTFSHAYDSNNVVDYAKELLGDSFSRESIVSNVQVYRKANTLLVKIVAKESSPNRAVMLSKAYTEAMQHEIGSRLSLSFETVEEPMPQRISRVKYAFVLGGVFGALMSLTIVYVVCKWRNRLFNIKGVLDLGLNNLGTAYVDV